MSLAHAAAGASTQPTQVLQSYLALHTEVVSVLQAKVAPRLSHSGVLPVCLFLETAVGVDLNWLMVLSTIVSSRLAMGIGPFRVWDFIGILGGSYPIVLPRRAAVSPFGGLLGMHVAMCRGAISATSPCVLVLAVSSGLSVVRLWVVCLLEPSVFSAFLVFFSVRRCARWLYLLRSGAHCNDYNNLITCLGVVMGGHQSRIVALFSYITEPHSCCCWLHTSYSYCGNSHHVTP